jgi:hypothetical protein
MALVGGSLSDSSRLVRGLVALGALYLGMQIICSTLAAVRGLSRTTWLRPGIDDVVPDPQAGPSKLALDRATRACERYQVMDRNVNFKVTQMAVAHTAIRNFAVGSVAIAVLGFVTVVLQTPVVPLPRQFATTRTCKDCSADLKVQLDHLGQHLPSCRLFLLARPIRILLARRTFFHCERNDGR